MAALRLQRGVAVRPAVRLPVAGEPARKMSDPQASGADMRRMPVTFRGAEAEGAEPVHVLCYGDSLTAGWCKAGAFFCPYGQQLSRELANSEVQVCGLSGRTAREMLEARDAAVATDAANVGHSGKGLSRMLDEGPDVAILLAGTNDLGHAGFDPSLSALRILERLKRLHGLCHARGVKTLAMTPPCAPREPFRSMQRELALMLQRWAASEPMVLGHFDVEELVPRSRPELWDDEIHMSRDGQLQLGTVLARALSNLLRARAPSSSVSSPRSERQASPEPLRIAARPAAPLTARALKIRRVDAIAPHALRGVERPMARLAVPVLVMVC